MKYILSRLLFISLLFFPSIKADGQTGINYTFSQQPMTMTFNNSTAGSVSLIPGGVDDTLVSFPAPALWGGFYFGGVWYPQDSTMIYVSSNGWISIQKQGDDIPPGALPSNSLASNPYRIITPLWDDLEVHADGEVTYKVTGGAASRALVVEWRGMYWDHNQPGVNDTAISFQVIIYDHMQTAAFNRSLIEFRYKRNGSSTQYVNNTSGGASIGLSGFCNNDVFAFTVAGGPPDKTFPETSDIVLKPVDALNHRFTPIAHPFDNCASAEMMIFDPALPVISSVGSTLQATQSPDSLPACGVPATTSDVWFAFTKPAKITNFEIYTDSLDCRGINFSTGLEVYTSCGGAPVVCDYGSAGPAGTNATSYLNLTNQPCTLQQYWVRVYSADTSYRGYFRFNIRPPGRNCAFATDINACGIPFSSYTGLSTCGFGNDYDSSNAEPHISNLFGEDYVFTYTPTATECLDFALNNTPANSNPGLFIYRGCPGFNPCIAFVTGTGGSILQFNNVTVISGQTYYIVVDYDSSGGTACLGGFDLTVTTSLTAPPVNDDCSSAVNANVVSSQTCLGTIDFTVSCSSPTPAGTFPLPGCGQFTDGVTPDVWFTFTSNGVAAHQVNVDPGTAPAAQDLAMAVYSGTCGVMTLVNCNDNGNGNGMPSLTVVPPASGTVFYVRIWSINSAQPGNFRICVLDSCAVANNFCAGAIPLTISLPAPGDNTCGTGTAEPFADSSAACWINTGGSTQLNTLWYSFTATDTTMRIRTRLITLFDSQIALYSSSSGCGGAFTELFCNDNAPQTCGASPNRFSEITATGLTVGETYYIRVDGTNGNTGEFEIVVVTGTGSYPPVFGQDCELAIPLCNNNTIVVNDPGYQGIGNICDLGGTGTCLASGERHSAWYTFSVTGTGAGTPVEFIISPNNPSDFDFMLWCVDTIWDNNPNHVPVVPDYCAALADTTLFPATACNFATFALTGCDADSGLCPIPCHQAGGAGSSAIMPAIVVPDGMTATFVLLLNNFTTSATGYSIDWMGTPINSTPPYAVWQNASNTNWADSANWSGGACGGIPDCNNKIPAIIAAGPVMPVITTSITVNDITITPGASLTISSGMNMDVCGDFANFGTLNNPGSAIIFIGDQDAEIEGTFNPAFNNFWELQVAKDSGATLTLQADLYITNNYFVYSRVDNNGKNTEVGGVFLNSYGDSSFTGLGAGTGGSTLTFTGRSGSPQSFRNDTYPLTLNNVVMNQVSPEYLSLFNNATSDLVMGPDGSLLLASGKIITDSLREVLISNPDPASCSAGNPISYVEGNLNRAIDTVTGTYEFPVGDFVRGYQRFAIDYIAVPAVQFNLLAKFSSWSALPMAPSVVECGNYTYDSLPVFDNGYWTLKSNDTTGIGIYNATAFPIGFTNNAGTCWTIMKSVSNNGQGPWGLEGAYFSGSTLSQVRRDSLLTFSDFAVIQADFGIEVIPPSICYPGFKVYPNPARNEIFIQNSFESSSQVSFTIYDMYGREVTKSNLNASMSTQRVNLGNLSQGIYCYSFFADGKKIQEGRIVLLK